MKYYIIAGEASGDLHGSNLMRAIKDRDPKADFRVWGGDRMESMGGKLVKHFRDLAFMGFAEVLFNLRTILGNLKFCKSDIEAYHPDVLILIDYPGFNLRIAEFAHQKNYKIIYYISPQIWAWKQNRVYKIRQHVNRMLCILPFEQEFYQKFDFQVDFVGHPLIDAIARRPEYVLEERRKDFGLDERDIITLLPGSRKQEISSMLPVMAEAALKFPDYQIVVAAAPSQDEQFYRELLKNKPVKIISGKTYELLEISKAALVTSGTATLEAALFKVPEVVCYRGNWLSYMIARQLVKVPYISLVNLIAGREVVVELIQSEMNVERVKNELKKCLSGGERVRMMKDYDKLIEKLGGEGASAKAAEIIIEEAAT